MVVGVVEDVSNTSCLGRVAVHPGRVALPVTLNRRADVCFLVISFIVIS